MQESVRERFLEEVKKEIKRQFGEDALRNPDYGKIINEKHYRRVLALLDEKKIVQGGRHDDSALRLEPTVMDQVTMNDKVMGEEIFGPIFPIITLDDSQGTTFAQKVAQFVNARPKPLAFYFFGKEKTGWQLIHTTSSGGACINDNIMHIVNTHMPFGGVGNSGMGSYHRRLSFETFTHRRSVLVSPRWLDVPFRYMPYKLFKFIRHIV